ncbi:MAG: hypothetical protein IPJ39_21130 [Saprospiraceae bacterium]|nr:hypothetical protein [Saprospiraceae bacterium]
MLAKHFMARYQMGANSAGQSLSWKTRSNQVINCPVGTMSLTCVEMNTNVPTIIEALGQ